MAVVLQPSGIGTLAYPYYTGESSDIKPTPTTDDATFEELDTGRKYVWKGNTWRLRERPAQVSDSSQLFTEILAELRKVRYGLETYLGQDFIDPGE